MSRLTFDFSRNAGRMRPMHAVNNGPVYKFTSDQRITNIDAFRDAAIPYARTHDAAFFSSYGGEHTVDILAIFPDFDKDADDPASYDFCLTDEYPKVMTFAGVEPFYRLGSKIEHWPKKYGTLVPPDYNQWAKIAEHIIAHYTEGWADGFNYKIDYWEIWNEPDGAADDADYVDKKCWGGTRQQFLEFYAVVSRHLKARFPHLKIGGPAVCYPVKDWVDAFLGYVAENKLPLDFFSWHDYAKSPSEILETETKAREILDSFGLQKTESILNEWNYVKGWVGDEWLYSLRMEKGLKGSSFIAGTIAESQYRPLDLLMYYDARPCAMNGMFATDFVCDKLKGYYPFLMFNKLYQLGTAVPYTEKSEDLYACAASGEGKKAIMVTHYQDLDSAEAKELALTMKGLSGKPTRLSYYVLDAENDMTLFKEETTEAASFTAHLTLPLFTTVLLVAEEQ